MQAVFQEFQFWRWLLRWSDTIGILASGILSYLLVVLYRQQKDLKKSELNRDVRTQHTEVLRERIRYWLDAEDNDPNSPRPHAEGLDFVSTRLPVVKRTTVDPAQDNSRPSAAEESDFRVLPVKLVDDEYVADFLENHARDVDDVVSEIHTLNTEFETLQSEFIEECEIGERFETEDYVLRPIEEGLARWVFKRIIELERGFYTKEEIKPSEGESLSGQRSGRDDEDFFFRGSDSDSSEAVYLCQWKSVNREQFYEDGLYEEAEASVINALRNSINQINTNGPHQKARRAGQVLDEMEQKIEELEHLLRIYEGKPLYGGDCKFLEEASIS